jgi:hypothetical protein
MALMLRKACQPALNDADLDAFHADMDNSKRLVLFTPCGKRFAVVHGITFGRYDVTKSEIEFTVELLGDWLLRNDKKIDTYIDAFTKQQQLVKPENEIFIGKTKIKISTKNTHERNPLTERYEHVVKPDGLTIHHEGVTFALDSKLNLMSISPDTKTRPTFPWAKDIVLTKDMLDAGVAQLTLCVEYRQCVETVQRILGELNSCTEDM